MKIAYFIPFESGLAVPQKFPKTTILGATYLCEIMRVAWRRRVGVFNRRPRAVSWLRFLRGMASAPVSLSPPVPSDLLSLLCFGSRHAKGPVKPLETNQHTLRGNSVPL